MAGFWSIHQTEWWATSLFREKRAPAPGTIQVTSCLSVIAFQQAIFCLVAHVFAHLLTPQRTAISHRRREPSLVLSTPQPMCLLLITMWYETRKKIAEIQESVRNARSYL
jgi:hypothetical protein